MKVWKKIGLLFLFVFMLGMCSVSALAAYPSSVSAKHPIIGYPLKTTRLNVYEDSGLTEKKTSLTYRSYSIQKIKGDALYVKYKVGSKYQKGWVSADKFFYDRSYEMQPSYANSAITLYKARSIRQSYVKIPAYTGGITLAACPKWYQTVFYRNGNYYLGWTRKKVQDSTVRYSMETTEQLLANGTYAIAPRKWSKRYLSVNAATGTMSVVKSNEELLQRFVLTHVKDNYYQIALADGQGYLAVSGGKLVIQEKATQWLLTRTGRYFYLTDKSTKKRLAYSSSGLTLNKARSSSYQMFIFTKDEEELDVGNVTVFSQYDPKWGGSTYATGYLGRKTISTSGCGVVALVNAIYALNGEYISPEFLATYSNKYGHYYYNSGTSDSLYPAFAKSYGKRYHFKWDGKVYTQAELKDHIQAGGVAVALVPGHYIAIVNYREKTDQYLVLDSAIYGKRPTTIYGDWVSASTLTEGTMNCEYYHLFSRR